MLASGRSKRRTYTFFQDFEWPQIVGCKAAGARDVFQRLKKAEDDVKCLASQGLGAHPVMQLFVADLLQARTDLGATRFAVFPAPLRRPGPHRPGCQRQWGVHGWQVEEAVEDHVKAFTAIHGDDNLPPKAQGSTLLRA